MTTPMTSPMYLRTAETTVLPRPTTRPTVDAARLWTGGLATAVVAALIGLVGVLVVRVLEQTVPHLPAVGMLSGSATTMLLSLIHI